MVFASLLKSELDIQTVSIRGLTWVFKIKNPSQNAGKNVQVILGNLRVILPKKFRIFSGYFHGKSLAKPQKIPPITPKKHAIYDRFSSTSFYQ
jgi:hypothetical protein